MIILRILDHDLHTSKPGFNALPLYLEIPARQEFLPAVISASRGNFIISRSLTKDGYIRTGVFNYDSDRIDDVISDMMDVACDLSCKEKWPNVFYGKTAPKQAFERIKKEGTIGQPHVCLVPESWTVSQASKYFGSRNFDSKLWKYKKYCRVVPCKIRIPTFCSRPDMVGMYTQFLGSNGSSIILHNIKRGLAFCLDNELSNTIH
jgi:hypothetical protein